MADRDYTDTPPKSGLPNGTPSAPIGRRSVVLGDSKRKAFEIDGTITLRLDVNLALVLGDFLVDSNPANPALWALGCQLSDLVPPKQK